MSQAIDVTGWHHERIAGYVDAIRGNQPSVEISIIVDSDEEQQMVMSLTDEPASDFTARRCETCQSITVSRILSLDGLPTPKVLDPPWESDTTP